VAGASDEDALDAEADGDAVGGAAERTPPRESVDTPAGTSSITVPPLMARLSLGVVADATRKRGRGDVPTRELMWRPAVPSPLPAPVVALTSQEQAMHG
jgi:hypothetical protein